MDALEYEKQQLQKERRELARSMVEIEAKKIPLNPIYEQVDHGEVVTNLLVNKVYEVADPDIQDGKLVLWQKENPGFELFQDNRRVTVQDLLREHAKPYQGENAQYASRSDAPERGPNGDGLPFDLSMIKDPLLRDRYERAERAKRN